MRGPQRQSINDPTVGGVDVREYGASTDRSDNDVPINAAILDASNNQLGEVRLPGGTFNIASPIIIRDNVSLVGTNRLATRISGDMASSLLQAPSTTYSTNAAERTFNCFVRDLMFDNRSGDAGSACLEWSQISLGGVERVDLRNAASGVSVENALLCNNNSINNHFAHIQATGCTTGYRMSNGANDNLWLDCRVSGCTNGFVVRPGSNGSTNNVNFWMCKVESFSSIGFDIDGDGGANFAEAFLIGCRLTSDGSVGPVGVFLGQTNGVQVRNSGVLMPHFDNVNVTIQDNSPAANRNWMNLQGIMFPLRIGAAGSNAQPIADDFSLLRYSQAGTQNLFRNNLDTVPQDVVVDGVTVQNLNGTQRVTTPRDAYSNTDLVAGDFALSAGWGTTASISAVAGTDQAGRFTVTSSGTGQAANPTITLTFPDGAMVGPPYGAVARSAGDQLTVPTTWISTTTTLVITFNGTPVAGQTYTFDFHIKPAI